MDIVASLIHYPPWLLVTAAAIMALGGFVKGAVGFALPMIAISGLGSLLSAQETIGLLIIPLALSNVWQTLRQGLGPALATFGDFWRLNVVMGVTIALVAQVVPSMPQWILFTCLGVLVTGAAALQLAGWEPKAPAGKSRRQALEIATGLVAGVAGGLSGVWGPPVLFFLISLGTPKTKMIRAQGIAFMIGSVILVGAHHASGLLDATAMHLGLLMTVPVGIGMLAGFRLQDRLDQARFRRMTLFVLTVAGLNLLRRGLL